MKRQLKPAAGPKSETKPIMTPLVRGDPARLSVDDQTTVARWMTKIAALMDLDGPEVLTQQDRFEIREAPTAPLGFHVRLAYWTGGIDRPLEIIWSAHGAAPAGEKPIDVPNAVAVTLRAGRLAVALVGGPGVNNFAGGERTLPLGL